MTRLVTDPSDHLRKVTRAHWRPLRWNVTGATQGDHRNPARQPGRDILPSVEHIFTGLLVLVTIAVMWFAGYVVYRLYSDQR